jgi:hypothetical protein
VCTAQQGSGVQISAAMKKEGGALVLEMDVTNMTQAPLQSLAIQLNKSSFGVTVQAAAIDLGGPIPPGQAARPFRVPLAVTPAMMAAPGAEVTGTLQVAIKNMAAGSVFYFQCPVPVAACLLKASPLDTQAFKAKWQGADKALESSATATPLPGGGDVAATGRFCAGRLGAHGMAEAVTVVGPDGVTRAYHHACTLTNVLVMVELSFKAGFPGCKVAVRCDQPAYAAVIRASVEQLLKL